MRKLKAKLITPSGTSDFVWNESFVSVYLDYGTDEDMHKFKIQCDGRVFECDPQTDEVIRELK